MLRKALFWTHLACGLLAGLVILMMSATGVVLSYERQMLDWADRRAVGPVAEGGTRMSVTSLLDSLAAAEPDFDPESLVVSRDPASPVRIGGGRGGGSYYVDPYSGKVLGPGSTQLRNAFGKVRRWHRWFDAAPEHRDSWRAVTGISNLSFLFLLVSGAYLWLPPLYRWSAMRVRLVFSRTQPGGRARDYNWHHVIGFWTSLPLVVIVSSAVVISYGWAGELVYRAFGDSPPGRSAPAAAAGDPAGSIAAGQRESLDVLVAAAQSQVDGWNRISLELPGPGAHVVVFTIDQGNGGQPQLRHELALHAGTGEVARWAPFGSHSPGRKARRWLRYLHTGEALGLPGQTIAGLVSLTTMVMIWTGFALAWRRLLSPLFTRRRL